MVVQKIIINRDFFSKIKICSNVRNNKLYIHVGIYRNDLSQDKIHKSTANFRKRLRACVNADSGHFEHFTVTLIIDFTCACCFCNLESKHLFENVVIN